MGENEERRPLQELAASSKNPDLFDVRVAGSLISIHMSTNKCKSNRKLPSNAMRIRLPVRLLTASATHPTDANARTGNVPKAFTFTGTA